MPMFSMKTNISRETFIMRSFARCGNALLLAGTVALALTASAQVSSSTILGKIVDASGLAVPSVDCTASNLGTNFTRAAQTDRLGIYAINLLPLGSYKLECSAAGFKKFIQSGIVLELNRSARVDAVLQLGTVSETVTVSEDALQVNTVSPTLGRTVSNREIISLPLVNRDVYALLSLTPGVDSNVTSNSLGYPEQRTIINGSAYSGVGGTNYFLDGGMNMTGLRNTGNPLPNPDAIQEFRVITNSYGAEFGRFSAGVIDAVTKSGTNGFHGSLFEFLRNEKLNANTWGATTKPPLRRNQFGGTFGGPIIRDKTFFFGSYSGLRQTIQEFRNTAIVPTALERAGDFSASAVKPLDPNNNRAPFPGALIPANRFDPAAKRILDQYIPNSNLPRNFFQVQVPHPYTYDEALAKVDHTFRKHMLTGSYFRNSGSDLESIVTTGNIPWAQRTFTWTQQNFNAGDIWTINPNTINQFRLTYMRNFGGRINSPEIGLGDLGSAFRTQGPKALPRITVTGYFTLQQAIFGPIAGSNLYSARDVLSMTRGRHNIKVGFDVSLEKFIQDTTLDNYGVFSIDGSRSANALSDFLLGQVRTMNQDAPITKIDNGWYYGLFFQDDFRVMPRLTLNFGMRYDLQLPVTDPFDRKATFVPGARSTVAPKALPGMLFPGDPGVGRGIVGADKNNFAPRFGFAYDLEGNGRTAIRGAFGVFFGSISGNEWNSTSDRQPFAVRQQFNNIRSLSDPYGLIPGGSPFPYSYDPANPKFITPAAIAGIGLDFRWPYTYQMNFTVERQLIKDLTVSAGYVSSLGHKLPFTRDQNYPLYNPTATAANVDARRPFASSQLAYVGVLQSSLNNAYHGMQMTLEKRLSRGFSFKGYYTFSKSLDGAQSQNQTTEGGAQNQNNLRNERGRTDNDRTHNAVASVVWDLNYAHTSKAILNYIANGWQVSAISTFRSGLPLTPTVGRDNNLDGTNNDRPNLISDPRLDSGRPRSETTAMWYNPASFVQNPVGTDGLMGRNVLVGPGLRNVDFGIFRSFKVKEMLTLQFRAEFTNGLNLVNLSNPLGVLTSPGFGSIRTARDMRQTQLGMRAIF